MRYRVLLLGSDGTSVQAAAGILDSLQCQLSTSASPSGEAPPDLILLQLERATGDGLAPLHALRQHPQMQPVPIIVLSADLAGADVNALFLAGATDYACFPLQPAELSARVAMQQALWRSRNGEHAQPANAATQPGKPPAAAQSATPIQTGVPAGSQPKILLVDDSPSNIRTLIQFLREDYKTLVATSGPLALEIAGREALDLILLDVVMPDMDGYEVCRQLKAGSLNATTPVIFVTGKNEEEDEMTGFELGAVDYIAKPFSLPVVQRRIRTHLELKHYRDQLERQSLLDGLTGIPNRRHFETFVQRSWAQAIRQHTAFALILIDVDHFKNYNDHYGHPAGDECLRRVAAALQGSIHRDVDLLARYGGEEFVGVLPGTDLAGALQVAEGLRAAVAALAIPHAQSSAGATVTISLGAASSTPGAGELSAGLLEAADQALYRAKQGGRNRVGS